jgi:hypothetical protein
LYVAPGYSETQRRKPHSKNEKGTSKMPSPPLIKVGSRNVGGKDGFQITIMSNIAAQKKNLAKFSAIGVNRATYRALNKTGGKANTQLKRDISNSYNLAQKEFKGDLTQQKAGPNKLTYAIRGTGKQIPIIKVKGGKKQTSLGVKINTGKGSQVLRGHFIARMASGHIGVYRRKDNAVHKKKENLSTGAPQWHALGITERKFPSVAHMVSNKARGARVWRFVETEYQKQLWSQLNSEALKVGATI